MRRAYRNLNFAAGCVLSSVVIVAACLSLVWTPFSPNEMDASQRLSPPGGIHLMGTDQYGRDISSRVMAGAANSIMVGLVTVAMGMMMGVALGLLAAYFRRWAEEGIMRGADLLFSFPAVLTAILITPVFGPSVLNAMIAIGIFYIPVFARLTRGIALGLWEREFVAAARACGLSDWSITWRHILPNAVSHLIVQGTVQFSVAVLAEAGLSYLGLGTQPPYPSWGRMLYEAQTFLSSAPWMALFPGLAIAWAVLGFNLLGDGLRDLLDPRMLRRG